jgi:hypothetical protein
MPLLQPYTPNRMCGVVAIALGISATVFVALSVGSSLAFGIDQLETNVLNNFSADDLAPFVGHAGGEVLSWVIRGGYLASVLGSLLLYMYPLRSCLAEVIWGAGYAQSEPHVSSSHRLSDRCDDVSAACSHDSNANTEGLNVRSSSVESVDATVMLSVGSSGSWVGEVTEDPSTAHLTEDVASGAIVSLQQQQQQQQPRWQRLEQRWYFTLTYGLLLCMVLVAVLVPSIWSALSLIGDLACTTQAFMLPGAIALVLVFKCGRLGSSVLCASVGPPQAAGVARPAAAAAAAAGGGVEAGFSDVAGIDIIDTSMALAPHAMTGSNTPTLPISSGAKSETQQHGDAVVLVVGHLHPPLLRLGSRKFGMLHLLQGQRQGQQQQQQQLHSQHVSDDSSTVPLVGAGSGLVVAGRVAYVVLSGFVVLLGMVLFANGVWQRV